MLNIIKKYWDAQAFFITLTWFVAIGLIGMFDLFEMSFDTSRLKQPDYWAEVFTLLMAGVLIFAMTLFYKYMRKKEEDTKSAEKEDSLNTNLDVAGTADLPFFVNDNNLKRRIVAYKDKMAAQYSNLITKTTIKHPKSLDIWLKGTEQQKKKDKWCKKITRIESLMSDEFIEENKYTLDASFVKITPNFIQNGVNVVKKNSSLENPSNSVSIAVRDNALNFILPIATTGALIGMVLTTTEQTRWMFIFMLFLKTFVLLIQHMSAVIYTPVFYKKTRVSDLSFRYRLAEDYVTWKTKQKEAKNHAKTEQQQPRSFIRSD